MDDMISREAAIKFIFGMPNKADEEGYIWVVRKEVAKGIDALPSAQPIIDQVKRGKWIDAEHAPFDMWYATCSECGKRQTLEYLNYCPNCGARMGI